MVEHCVSSTKGCGFDSEGTHILMKMYNLKCNCKSLWIKASAKCVNSSNRRDVFSQSKIDIKNNNKNKE